MARKGCPNALRIVASPAWRTPSAPTRAPEQRQQGRNTFARFIFGSVHMNARRRPPNAIDRSMQRATRPNLPSHTTETTMSRIPHELHDDSSARCRCDPRPETGNAHFAKLAEQHHEVNREVHRIETEIDAASDGRPNRSRRNAASARYDCSECSTANPRVQTRPQLILRVRDPRRAERLWRSVSDRRALSRRSGPSKSCRDRRRRPVAGRHWRQRRRVVCVRPACRLVAHAPPVDAARLRRCQPVPTCLIGA